MLLLICLVFYNSQTFTFVLMHDFVNGSSLDTHLDHLNSNLSVAVITNSCSYVLIGFILFLFVRKIQYRDKRNLDRRDEEQNVSEALGTSVPPNVLQRF